MKIANARLLLVGRTITDFDLRPSADPNGTCHDPVITPDNGARVTFTVEETDSGDGYGVRPDYHPPDSAAMSEPLTGETITDEQIRELRCMIRVERVALLPSTSRFIFIVQLNSAERHCIIALGEKRASRGFSRASSRARCAELMNARNARNATKDGAK